MRRPRGRPTALIRYIWGSTTRSLQSGHVFGPGGAFNSVAQAGGNTGFAAAADFRRAEGAYPPELAEHSPVRFCFGQFLRVGRPVLRAVSTIATLRGGESPQAPKGAPRPAWSATSVLMSRRTE